MSEFSKESETWIVIPAYNEAEAVGRVVGGVRPLYRNVVVVDDGSTDDTARAALRAGATVLVHPVNLGQGAALQTGIDFAVREGAQRIVTFDADGQQSAADIAVLETAQRESGADVVLGSRFLGGTINMPRSRGVLLKAAIHFTRLTTGMRLTDTHNGLRLLTRAAALRIRLRQNRMAHASEILDQIRINGLTYVEAPVTITYDEYSQRKGQRSSNSFYILMELLVAKLGS